MTQTSATVSALLVLFALFDWQHSSFAQTKTTDFDIALKACADNKKITIAPYLLEKMSALYADEATKNTLNGLGSFLSQLPESDRGAGYGIYQQCVVDILPVLKNTGQSQGGNSLESKQPVATVTYKVCSGEYERACQQHDVYLYCYVDVRAWAAARCATSTVSRYNTYGGNKCGYSMDLVTCTGPK